MKPSFEIFEQLINLIKEVNYKNNIVDKALQEYCDGNGFYTSFFPEYHFKFQKIFEELFELNEFNRDLLSDVIAGEEIIFWENINTEKEKKIIIKTTRELYDYIFCDTIDTQI